MLLKESMVDYNTFPYFHLFSIIFKKLEAENKIPRVCIVVHSYTANIVPLVSGYCLESKQKKNSMPFILIRNCTVSGSKF